MKQQLTFILGANDPEMVTIERIVTHAGHRSAYALKDGARVHPSTSYSCNGVTKRIELDQPRVWVECGPALPVVRRGTVVDHHSPGDPGYGLPPERYWDGSSIGQVCNMIGVCPDDELRFVAAADHCLGSAYAGRCPGIDPERLRIWRAESRAAWRQIRVADFHAEVERAIAIIRGLPKISLQGHEFADATDARIGELSEASAVIGIPVMYALTDSRSGRPKAGVLNGTPTAMATWLKWAQTFLKDAYGDPERGYAGAYLD